MKAVVQRVSRAEVRVAGKSVGRIERGALILLGVMKGDDERCAERLAERCARFRFFPDPDAIDDRMTLSLVDASLAALVVSQFTLAADGKKGRRPSFDAAAPPEAAEPLYLSFVEALRACAVECRTGSFGARMEVELVGDGPVTFVLDESPRGGA